MQSRSVSFLIVVLAQANRVECVALVDEIAATNLWICLVAEASV